MSLTDWLQWIVIWLLAIANVFQSKLNKISAKTLGHHQEAIEILAKNWIPK